MPDSHQQRPQPETSARHSDAADGGVTRRVREFHMSRGERVGNTIVSVLARVGIGPFQLLTTRGRKTGRPHSTPVTLVERDGVKWLVAPYGAVSWVHNARAAGQVTLRRGRETPRDYGIRELRPDEAGPVLERYIGIASATRPYFEVQQGSSASDFIAEAHRHPVFELAPLGEDVSQR